MAERRFYWLKLPDTFLDSKPVRKLRQIAGGDTYVIIYLKMLLASMKDDGKLYLDGYEDDPADEIALGIGENPKDVAVTLQFLLKSNLAELKTDEVFLTELPNMIGSEAASTLRSRRSRNRAKALQCNDAATICNVEKRREEIEESREDKEEIREDKRRVEQSREEVTVFDASDLDYSFELYLSIRREIGAVVNETVIASLKEELERLSGGSVSKKIAILDQSIDRRWKWIFPIKNG